MTRLIMVQRAFENAAAMMRDTESTLRRRHQDARRQLASRRCIRPGPAATGRRAPQTRRRRARRCWKRLWQRFADQRALLTARRARHGSLGDALSRARPVGDARGSATSSSTARHAGTRSGEIVQIGPDQVLVAPFEHSADAGVGDAVFNRGPFNVAPRRLLARPRRRCARPPDRRRPGAAARRPTSPTRHARRAVARSASARR